MELQDLNPKRSPHLEERWIGGNVDLDLLLQSSKDQRVWVEGLGDLVVLSLNFSLFLHDSFLQLEGKERDEI